MKQSMSFLILAALLALALYGCAKASPARLADDRYPEYADAADKKAPLPQGRFFLQSVDGLEFDGKERPVEIAFVQDAAKGTLRVSGSVCNRFAGQGRLEQGRLTVKQMVATKMFCADQERNALESALFQYLEQGAELFHEGGMLVLRGKGRELHYRLAR